MDRTEGGAEWFYVIRTWKTTWKTLQKTLDNCGISCYIVSVS